MNFYNRTSYKIRCIDKTIGYNSTFISEGNIVLFFDFDEMVEKRTCIHICEEHHYTKIVEDPETLLKSNEEKFKAYVIMPAGIFIFEHPNVLPKNIIAFYFDPSQDIIRNEENEIISSTPMDE
jgi:hypothetical protein